MLQEIDLSRSDLNLLVLFEAVLEEGHVGRAALRLSLSPSAVSHGLGRLRRLLNDPLFLRTPKGVVPTARAGELAHPIAEVLARARQVIASAVPFDPATSTRRFTLGAPDGISGVILPPLLDALRVAAPRVALTVRQIMPVAGVAASGPAWRGAIDELEARAIDVAILPSDDLPQRFHRRLLAEEDFVVAVRAGHPYAEDPTLERYCAMDHLVVSHTGEAYGFVDARLAAVGRSRRIALTLPNFMFALAVVARSDLLAALPRRFVALFAPNFGVVGIEPPLPLGRFRLNAVASKAAMMDAGVAWLIGLIAADAGREAGGMVGDDGFEPPASSM